MNHFFIPLLVCLFTLSSTTSFACKEGPDYNFEKWLKLNDKELQWRNCEREQIKLRMFSHNNDTKKVIESGKKLRKNHILDKTDLNYEADALYTEKRYDEALGVFLLSQDSLKIVASHLLVAVRINLYFIDTSFVNTTWLQIET